MSITKETKQKLIGRFQINDKDTGSSEVQVSILTERIRQFDRAFQDPQKGQPFPERITDNGFNQKEIIELSAQNRL